MQGLTMDYELNVGTILRRGEELFGHKTITSRLPDKSWHTYTYADFARRAKQLSLALRDELGLVDGDRVATFAWNHHEHMEAYLGAPDTYDAIEIAGSPPLKMKFSTGIHGDIATASITVNSIPKVLDAAPGLHTMRDMPLPSFFGG